MKKLQGLGCLVVFSVASLVGCGASGPENETGKPSTAADSEMESGQVGNSDGEDGSVETQAKDIVETAVAAGEFNTLAKALGAAGLVETLKSEGPFTVFAPTDEAFAKLPSETLEGLLKPENKDQLVAILTYHVVPGRVDAAAASSLDSAKTVNGAMISITKQDGVKINEATVTKADIVCSNGMIHVIDSVILPPSSETNDTSKAPHAGEPLTVEGVGSFATLFAAIKATGLDETLKKDGPFTVFAPTDQAFAALPEGTVENLLKPQNKEQLIKILTYHAVAGEVKSDQVVKLETANSVQGNALSIKVADGRVQVNDANVLKTDIPCEIGLIHAIDKVLMP